MCPTDVYFNDQLIATVGPGNETKPISAGIVLAYMGDEYRGYGLTQHSRPVDSGQVPTDGEIVISVNSRLVAHPEKGQPADLISDRVRLKFRPGKET